MKTTKILIVVAVILSSFPIFAQQADAKVQQSSSATAAGSQVNQSADAGAQANRHGAAVNGYGAVNGAGDRGSTKANQAAVNGSGASAAEMRPVSGELVGKLDAKSARPGDPVVFKTTQKARTADGTVLPRGTRIFGHVTEVQAHSKSSQESHLGLEFDRAELKGGQSMAIHSVIESISPAGNAMAAAGAMDSDGFFSPAPMGGGMAMGGARSGGGLIWGGGSGLVGGARSLAADGMHATGSAVGSAGAGLGSAPGNLGMSAGSTANGALNSRVNRGGLNAAGALNGAAGANGTLVPRPTGIPGLMLAGGASGSASGMLSASRKNVHLDSGTQMVLGVSSAVSR